MSNKILFVDDDPNILSAYQRSLRKDFNVDFANGGEQALALIQTGGPYAVIVSDMQMPRMNGIQFLIKAQERAPNTVRLMLTGNADQQTASDAVNHGHIFRFLNKPCSPEELTLALKAGLEQYRLVTAERELLEKTVNGCAKVLSDILSLFDPQSFGRGQRLRDRVRSFAETFKIPYLWELELAAMLSQLGRVTVPAVVLEKARTHQGLSGPEKDLITRIPQLGASLLANIPRLESAANVVLYQNKNFDGTGFPPDKIAGEEIPIGARILKVLSDLLVLEDSKLPTFKALAKMQQCPGRYDPAVLKAVAAGFDVDLAAAASEDRPTKALSLDELRVGQILKAGVQTRDGTLVVHAGVEVSPMLLVKLRNFAELSGLKEPLLVAA